MEPLDPLHRLGHGQSQRRRDSELGQGKLALVDEQVFQVGAVEPQRQLAQGSIAACPHLVEDCRNPFASFARYRPRRARPRRGALRLVEFGPLVPYRQTAPARILPTGPTLSPPAPTSLTAPTFSPV